VAIREAIRALFGNDDVYRVEYLGPTFREMVLGLTPEEMYRTQPYLRQVISFVARSVGHLGVKVYERQGESRVRLRDDPVAQLLARPNAEMTGFELFESLASDLGLYDIAYWWLREVTDPAAVSGWEIQPIPPSWVQSQETEGAFSRKSVTFIAPNGRPFTIPASDLLIFHGWNPGQPKVGSSPIEALKEILSEQVQAWSYRQQIWSRGGRVGAFLTRPAGVAWSPEARDRFIEQWKARWTGINGAKAGGTPILEDGMELKRLGFNAREEEWAEVSKIALATVAGAYHVNPIMVGILDNANFSNTKEFRKMLYSETLGPTLARIEARLNAFLVPRVSRSASAYVEFNIEQKLQGDFEEQAAILSTSAGAPWMSRNEVRALRNLPAIPGGDEMVIPLNVLIGGQASPRDAGEQNVGGVIAEAAAPVELRQVKSLRVLEAPVVSLKSDAVTPMDPLRQLGRGVLARFYARQRGVVLARLGAKADGWWDEDRWNSELADDLYRVAVKVAGEVGVAAAESLGFSAGDYDEGRTLAFLRAVAESRAGAINAATKAQLDQALSAASAPAAVFDRAESQRVEAGAAALVAAVAGFAVMEAGRQLIGDRASKTWVVTSANPRPEHADMNGESVAVGEVFSNGALWPGDPVLRADGVAGCECAVQINYRGA
jgi:HK97 family phage portal protein